MDDREEALQRERESAFDRLIISLLGRTIDFVKYGDGKNAALLAFGSAWLAGIGTIIVGAKGNHVSILVLILLYVAEFLFFIGIFFSIWALLPITKPEEILNDPQRMLRRLFRAPCNDGQPNLLFFGHIKDHDKAQFRNEFASRYLATGNRLVTPEYVDDACAQILINSCIAQRKFNWFNISLAVVSVALLCVLVAISVSVFQTVVSS